MDLILEQILRFEVSEVQCYALGVKEITKEKRNPSEQERCGVILLTPNPSTRKLHVV